MQGPFYIEASDALDAAHKACFSNPDRPVTGMSHRSFSGVNVALGIVAQLEKENARMKLLLAQIALQYR